MAALTEVAERLPLPIGNPAFTPDGRLFVSHHPMFEIPALPDAELVRRVEPCASRPNAGGCAIASEDNLHITELGGWAIGVIPAADRTYRRLAEHPEMLWLDGLAWGPDGMLHVTVSQLLLAPPLNGGTRGDRQPHLLMRMRPLAPGQVAG